MKKLLALLAFAFLTSCIDVEDISEVWGKGVVDPALAGTWSVKNDAWRFVKEGDAYRVQHENTQDKPDDETLLARTIVANNRTFLLTTDKEHKNGAVFRFGVQGNSATQYGFKTPVSVMGWLKENHPQEKNITLTSKDMMGASIKVLKLDMETLAVLAEIPDEYWEITATYTKHAN